MNPTYVTPEKEAQTDVERSRTAWMNLGSVQFRFVTGD